MGGKEDPEPIAAIVVLDALTAQIAALDAQLQIVTGHLDVIRERNHLVSHEVRTPLTVVLGVLATLEQADVTEVERRRLQARALTHAQRLREVVDELLVGDAPPRVPIRRAELQIVRLAPLLRTACKAVPANRLSFDLDEAQLVATAPLRLQTVVTNLVANAVRNGTGPIEVAAHVGDLELTVTVTDAGPGLRGADPEALFEPRRRRTDAPGQRGSGLYLARLLARSLGGDLTLGDHPHGGLVATLTLPQRRGDDPVGRGSGAGAARTPRPAGRVESAARP